MRYLPSGKIIIDNLEELREIVKAKEIPLDLIDIKESGLTSLSYVFYDIDKINGSIEDWDISDITSLEFTFYNSKIQQDVSKWNTSNVIDMYGTFENSNFNGDISKWDVSNVISLYSMFSDSPFNGDISKWNVSNVRDFKWTFASCNFDGDISEWNINENSNMLYIFDENQNFINKYNFDSSILNDSIEIIEWFNKNKVKMFNLNINVTQKEQIDDYLSEFNINFIK